MDTNQENNIAARAQNNSMSDKAKEDLRGLLLSIADQLKCISSDYEN